MLVSRRTFTVKRGRIEEAVALVKANREQIGGTHRIYVSITGTFDTIALEFEGESVDEGIKAFAEYFATPEGAAFGKKWFDLTEPGGTNEMWALVE